VTAAPDAADAPAPQTDPAPAEPTGALDEWSRPDAPSPDPTTPAGPPDSADIADRLFGPAPMLSTSEADTGTPGPAPAAPAQRRVRPLTIAMVVLAAAAIAVGVMVGPTAVRVAQQRNATLAMPEAVAELKRDDSESAKEAASDLVTALRAEIELDQSAAAVYSDPTNDPGKSIMLFGGTTLLLSPERELDAVLKLTEDAGDRIHGLQSVDPGPLGGTMKCGSTGTETSSMAVCGWADHGSIALALFPERSPADAAFLMRTLRSATLTR
jgi:hypothetical protein